MEKCQSKFCSDQLEKVIGMQYYTSELKSVYNLFETVWMSICLKDFIEKNKLGENICADGEWNSIGGMGLGWGQFHRAA